MIGSCLPCRKLLFYNFFGRTLPCSKVSYKPGSCSVFLMESGAR